MQLAASQNICKTQKCHNQIWISSAMRHEVKGKDFLYSCGQMSQCYRGLCYCTVSLNTRTKTIQAREWQRTRRRADLKSNKTSKVFRMVLYMLRLFYFIAVLAQIWLSCVRVRFGYGVCKKYILGYSSDSESEI